MQTLLALALSIALMGRDTTAEKLDRLIRTKTFTSTLILRLAAAAKLALTDKLSRWYPQLPFADSVTLGQMLSHTSGIYDFTREPPIKQAEEKTFVDIRHPRHP